MLLDSAPCRERTSLLKGNRRMPNHATPDHRVLIGRAGLDDAEEILDLQKLAYISEAELYDDYSIPPLVQTRQDIRDEFGNHIFLKSVENGRVIGLVRGL